MKNIGLTFLTFFICTVSIQAQEKPTLNDAVFSPDGQWIGMGTSQGLDIYERNTWALQYHRDFGKGVHFLRWSPDSTRLIVAYEQTEEVNLPKIFCAVMDAFSDGVLFEIKEPVRWFEYVRYLQDDDRTVRNVGDKPSTLCAHPNLIAFSEDGKLLAYIDKENRVRIWDIETEDLIQNIELNNIYLLSLGFIADTYNLWLGGDGGKLIYYDFKGNNVIKEIQLKDQNRQRGGYIIGVSKNLNYIVAANPHSVISVDENYSQYLFDQDGVLNRIGVIVNSCGSIN